MSLLVLAFPTMNPKSYNWIQSYRKKNDELYYNIVNPHFSIVFAIHDIAQREFIDEVKCQAAGIKKIEFELTKATLHKDAFKEYYHEFLVPGKGYHEILALHEKIYGNIFRPYLRTDIEYIPHITIANSKDEIKSERAIRELNSKNISIPGIIDELTGVSYLNNSVKNIISFQLE